MSDVQTKRCSRCGMDKPCTEFHARTRSPDGLGYRCKPCSLAYKRERYQSKKALKYDHVDAQGNPIRTCNTCHQDKPLSAFCKRSRSYGGLSHRCKECDHLKSRERYWADPEMAREKARRWRQDHPDQARARDKKHYQKHRERIALERALCPPQQRALRRKRSVAWGRNNPDAVRAIKATRRARKRNAGGSYSAKDVQHIYRAQQGCCSYCTGSLADGYHVDHMIPLVRGGRNDVTNICLACGPCNRRKASKTAEEYRALLHALMAVQSQ